MVCSTAVAQITDPVLASAKYRIVYTNNKTELVNDECQLDITRERSFFYSLGVIENIKRVTEKSEQAKATNSPIRFSDKDLRHSLFLFNTIKEYARDRSIVLEFVGDQTLGYVKDTLSNVQWEISSETKLIGNMTCRKALGRYGKISVTAWFCMDIPFRDGPLYYYGLPGLIVKLSDSQGWEAELTSIKYAGPISSGLAIEPYRLVSRAQFYRAKKTEGSMFNSGKVAGGGSIEKEN